MIVGLDIGTNCGWAVLSPDGTRKDSGVWRMTPRPETKTRPADHRAQRWLAMLGHCRLLFKKWRPAAVVYERGIVFGSRGRAENLVVHGGLRAQMEIAALEEDDIPLVVISPAEWKRAACGSGNAQKPAYITAANQLFGLNFDVAKVKQHEDEAAALCLTLAAIRLGKVGAA